MRNVLIGLMFLGLLTLAGCLSAFHRVDVDKYDGASATYTGNGRTTNMATSQPSAPAPALIQREPQIGEVFVLKYKGRMYEAMKKVDGKIYILSEVK